METTLQTNMTGGWYVDPGHRHQYRYWDGVAWTPTVSDQGVTATDPLPETEPIAQPYVPAQRVAAEQAATAATHGVDSRFAPTIAEYAKRQYKVIAVTGDHVTMERAKNKFSWLAAVMLAILTGGVGVVLYAVAWAVWGVHRTYRVTLAPGPGGEVEELGDDRAVYDRDRLQVHRVRCVGYEILLALFALMTVMGIVINVSSGQETDALAAAVGGVAVVVITAGIGFLPYYQARKAARQLGRASDWWRFGI